MLFHKSAICFQGSISGCSWTKFCGFVDQCLISDCSFSFFRLVLLFVLIVLLLVHNVQLCQNDRRKKLFTSLSYVCSTHNFHASCTVLI